MTGGPQSGIVLLMARHPRVPEIVCDPAIRSGEPCFSGTRVPVRIILHWLAEGWSTEDILRQYPDLTAGDIVAGLRFAADRVGAVAVAAE